jgi:Tfp pilus assembly protein PilP
MKYTIFISMIVVLSFSMCVSARDEAPYQYIVARNVFRPLWRVAIDSADQIEAARRKQFDQLQTDQAKRLEEMRQQQESEQKAAKKQQIESQLEVTGIVDDGNRICAFIQNKKDGKTYTVGVGDEVAECVVSSVDNKKSEVTLNYKNQFSVGLALK